MFAAFGSGDGTGEGVCDGGVWGGSGGSYGVVCSGDGRWTYVEWGDGVP